MTAFDDVPDGARAGRGGRRAGLPRPGGHPRPRERARADRVGGIRHRDPRGGGGRRHHAARHAAQQHPPDHQRGGARGQARRGAGRCAVDVGFLGGWFPGNAAELAPLHSAGVFGFKCFLCPSGVDEFPPMSPGDLREAAPVARGARRAAHGARRVARGAGARRRDLGRPAVLRHLARHAARSPRRRRRCDS